MRPQNTSKRSTKNTQSTGFPAKPKICIASAIAVIGLLAVSTGANGQNISLGSAETFAIVSAAGITNSGITVITGDVAISPLATITGFSFSTPTGAGVVTGTVHYNDALAIQAHTDALTAFNTLSGLTSTIDKSGLDLGGMTLTPGIYHFDTSVGLTGTLTLDTLGDPNAVFVFQIGSTLTTAAGSSVIVTGAGTASDPNVFWQVGSSATLGTNTAFDGNILALISVSLGTNAAVVNGSVIALTGAVTLLGNTVSSSTLVGQFWNGSVDNLWSSANWSATNAGAEQVALGQNAAVVFSVSGNTATQNQSTILDADTTIASLTVNNSAAVNIGGSNTLTISGTGATTGININSGAGLTTIGSNLVLGNLSQNITVNNADGLLISGVVGGGNGLTKSGTGVLTLTGIETYTGATAVTSGILKIGDGVTPGTSIAASNSVLVSNNSLLAINLKSGEAFGNSVTDNGVIEAISAGINTLSGILGGSGRLLQSGAGTTILTGGNSYGTTTISAGTLQVGNGGTAGTLGTGAVTDNASLTFNRSDTLTVANAISGSGNLNQVGVGTTILTGGNSYTGLTSINKGTLSLGNSSALAGGGNITFGGGTLQYSAANSVDYSRKIVNSASAVVIDTNNQNVTFASALDSSNTNGLTKVGAGTLTLANTSSYGGATTITAGTLQVGNGVTGSLAASSPVTVSAGTLAINLGDGDTFANNVTDNSLVTTIADGKNTLSGVINGSGSLSQEGMGVTVLTGANTFAGLTTVDHGTLTVNGSIAGNALVNGGTLRGFGRIGGNVTNRSLVVPGEAVTPGTLTIGGNYTQTAQGGLGIRLASTSNFDRLTVGGGANLNGTLAVGYLGGFQTKPGDVFEIITTQTGVNGQFSQFIDANANTHPLLTLAVVYQPTNVLLKVDQGSFSTVLSKAYTSQVTNGNFANELSVAQALDKLAAAKPSSPLIVELDRLSSTYDIAAALKMISPEDFAAIFNAGIAISNVQVGNIERRLEEARMGSTGFSDSGLVLTDSHGAQNYDNSGKNVLRPDGKVVSHKETYAPTTEDTERWGFFAAGVGEFTDVENTGSVRGSEFITGGVTVGADYRLSDHFVFGATMGYANTTSDLNAGGHLNIDSGKGSLYATVYDEGFYVNGVVGGGVSSYDTRRKTFGGIARGDTDGTDINALIGTGYDYHIGAFTVGPVASVRYTEVRIDGFTEKGALAPLHINSQSQDSFASNLGARASYALKMGHVIVTPEFRAQWQHEYLGDRAGVGSSFGVGDCFTVFGPRIGRDSLILDAGASVQLTSRCAVFAFYTGDLGRQNYTSHAINGGVRLSF